MTTTELTKKDMLLESLNELDFSNEPRFAQELRSTAKNAMENLEFPTSKTEYWKYTRIGKIINKTYGIQHETTENLRKKEQVNRRNPKEENKKDGGKQAKYNNKKKKH
jgi:hypothetical protein